jgi:hypothetical protein
MLKGDNLIFRFRPGDAFAIKRKDSKRIERSFIVSINDSTVITGYDTIPIHEIARVHKPRMTLLNVVGGLMMVGGIGYFVIDQFNIVVVNGDNANIDRGVAVPSVTLLAGGALLYYIRKKSTRIHGRVRLLSVDNKSSFYEPDYIPVKGYVSPYIPRN